MLIEISHRSHFRYEAPVFLEPHQLRFQPRADATQRLLSAGLKVEPTPAGRSDSLDLEGNVVTSVWYTDAVDHLLIEATSQTETLRTNPYDYLWLGTTLLPTRYDGLHADTLGPYRVQGNSFGARALAESVAYSVGMNAQSFLPALTTAIQRLCRWVPRENGDPMPPEETLRRREGSCRDLAVLFMEASRAMGFAARFVSGYHFQEDSSLHELHAWAEVYLPGGGWRGFDPTTGLAVADRHVAVASGAGAAAAAPITGRYRGNAASVLEAEVSVRILAA